MIFISNFVFSIVSPSTLNLIGSSDVTVILFVLKWFVLLSCSSFPFFYFKSKFIIDGNLSLFI